MVRHGHRRIHYDDVLGGGAHSLPYFTTHHDLADRQKAKKEGTEKSSDMQWTEDLTTTTQELMTN